MKTILTTVIAACTMVGGFSFSKPADPCTQTTIVHHGPQSLELQGHRAHVVDARGARRAAPVDQVVVATEKGPMAVLGDDAIPLTGTCEARAAERALGR